MRLQELCVRQLYQHFERDQGDRWNQEQAGLREPAHRARQGSVCESTTIGSAGRWAPHSQRKHGCDGRSEQRRRGGCGGWCWCWGSVHGRAAGGGRGGLCARRWCHQTRGREWHHLMWVLDFSSRFLSYLSRVPGVALLECLGMPARLCLCLGHCFPLRS